MTAGHLFLGMHGLESDMADIHVYTKITHSKGDWYINIYQWVRLIPSVAKYSG